MSVRQVQRLLDALNKDCDNAVGHGLRGKVSNRKIEETVERQAVKILSAPVYEGLGPTSATEYLGPEEQRRAESCLVQQRLGRTWGRAHR